MIKEIREIDPFIHLGFSRQEISVYKNELVKIWQDNIYNNDSYTTPLLSAPDSVIREENRNYFIIFFTATGTKNCKISFTGVGSKFLESNEITINVIDITADTNRFTADTNQIKSDGTYIL